MQEEFEGYTTVEASFACEGCAFVDGVGCSNLDANCFAASRQDKREVIFIKEVRDGG